MSELTKEHFDQVLEHLATKEDLKGLATETELQAVSDKLQTIAENVQDIKATVDRIDKRTDEDHRAVVKDVEKLKTRVEARTRQLIPTTMFVTAMRPVAKGARQQSSKKAQREQGNPCSRFWQGGAAPARRTAAALGRQPTRPPKLALRNKEKSAG